MPAQPRTPGPASWRARLIGVLVAGTSLAAACGSSGDASAPTTLATITGPTAETIGGSTPDGTGPARTNPDPAHPDQTAPDLIQPPSAPSTTDDTYAPRIDPATFTEDVTHDRFPLLVGSRWTYEVTTAEGSIDVLHAEVLADTRQVMGVTTRAVLHALTVDGEIEEETESWYAQDDRGAVWLFGEIDRGYEGGELVETTTWEAGVDGALPGVAMPETPIIGESYRVGFVVDTMEERGMVTSVDEMVDVAVGGFDGVWIVENWSDLEPDVVERKLYARSVGLVFQDADHPDADTLELVDFTGG